MTKTPRRSPNHAQVASALSIPLNARIVAVADAFDAMTSGKSYQPAVSDEAALAELRRCRGSHFDPRCVDAFEAAFGLAKDKTWFPMARSPLEHSHGAAA